MYFNSSYFREYKERHSCGPINLNLHTEPGNLLAQPSTLGKRESNRADLIQGKGAEVICRTLWIKSLLISHKKEANPAIHNNMDKPGGYIAK